MRWEVIFETDTSEAQQLLVFIPLTSAGALGRQDLCRQLAASRLKMPVPSLKSLAANASAEALREASLGKCSLSFIR